MNPLDIFTGMLAELKKIRSRLSPDNPTQRIVHLIPSQALPGTALPTISLNGPFNTMVTNLRTGNILVYIGSAGATLGTPPDLFLEPSPNPLTIPIGTRYDKNITFVVDPLGPPASGSIIVEFY